VADVIPALVSSSGGRPLARLVAAGFLVSAVLAGIGLTLGRTRFGADDRVAIERIEAELRQRFAVGAETLASLAAPVVASRDLIRTASRDPSDAGRLFDLLDAVVSSRSSSAAGITVYAANGAPIAWAGRVSDLPRERIDGPAAFFVAQGALGSRLVRVEPVLDPDRLLAGRIGAVVIEQPLGELRVSPRSADAFALSTSLAPVSLRVHLGEREGDSPYSFVIPLGDGQLLVEAHIDPADLGAARARWRDGVHGVALFVVGLTLLLGAVRLNESRRRARTPRSVMSRTGMAIAIWAGTSGVMWLAARRLLDTQWAVSIGLLLSATFLAVLVWFALDVVERWHLTRPPLSTSRGRQIAAASAYLIAGALSATILYLYTNALRNVLELAAIDLLRFSINPLGPPRLVAAVSLVMMHAAVVWAGAMLLRLVSVAFRRPRSVLGIITAASSWVAGIALAVTVASRLLDPVPVQPLLTVLAAVGVCGIALARPRGRARRASQAARLALFFAAAFVPALSMYPMLHALATSAKERLIAAEFGPQALHLRDNLQDSLRSALEAIDSLPSLGAFVSDPGDGTSTTDEAFRLWASTDLAALRLTSAVELYAADGELSSRFALNLPEYASTAHIAATCEWDLFEEVSPFGSSERHVLRASRGICEGGQRLGSVVVRAMLDFRTLPFISSESPYVESFRPEGPTSDSASSRDIEYVVYGWSRAPIYASGPRVWPMPDTVFDRMVASRAPIWAPLARNDAVFRVHFLNDRGGIHALGYPVITPFGHLINLAELLTLCGVIYLLLVGGGAVLTALTSGAPASGRALWREVRSSFYRKLFLALVGAAVVPVVVLAVATRTYFAAQFRAGIEESAVQTATVAQRLVEDYATLQELGTGALGELDDQIMVLVGRAIDQAVNLFDRERLQATSERDLFASGLLPTRTPAQVYRAIVLDRLPTFVGEEEVGDFRYLLAAAPARAGGREGIVTVPQTLRRQEIERQIDELDRRVLFASVLFVLLGAGIGYWMAERIADPVKRLTRATRRIALGDLDARIAATSSDELRRLVEDFNQMAADLKRQRAELERTQRLEAWAEMARQVAHDIKNPLTPIQLSAEHARRVNQDRGRPLSPALDDCVDAILSQVKLLRQISAEFSSFASSPTPRPEATDLPALIEEVITPYRTALTGRIVLDVQSPHDLPIITLDRTLFARAMTNIIENAIHAMPAGGRITITSRIAPSADLQTLLSGGGELAAVSGERFIAVQISDTGIGMDPESAARIFEPYFSTKATGTGLGLTIAKRNVELNGGRIVIASTTGIGTTVTIILPV
jgi:signal transduction histidine kinase